MSWTLDPNGNRTTLTWPETGTLAFSTSYAYDAMNRLTDVFQGAASSGVLLGHYLGVVRIETFYLDLTFNIVAILVIGGSGSLAGAVFGTIVIATMAELLRHVEIGFQIGDLHVGAPAGLADVVVALGMLLIILFRPKGITNGRGDGRTDRAGSGLDLPGRGDANRSGRGTAGADV